MTSTPIHPVEVEKKEVEEWKDFSIFKELQISSFGNLRFKNGDDVHTQITPFGYQRFFYRGKGGKYFTHKAVAMTFIRNPRMVTVVNHMNYDKLDNRASNLEWVTRSENMIHAKKKKKQ